MTIGQKHDAIAAQYYKELDKANATIYHYSIVTDKPNKQIIKAYLNKRGCNSITEYLTDESVF
jgi:hypothetical protein